MPAVQNIKFKKIVTSLIYPALHPSGARQELNGVKILLLPTCLNLFRIFDLANIGIIFLNFVVLDSFAL
ncbi:hypothetical protein AGR4C_pa60073 [Agrobacterium tumefaciens str. Kerr 14]|uniref:Uncharacterized protein n=1 Tax=Agrobacterium tumefaciens str. Kerr 14 TaxID=1183424 RepID=A0A1S7SBQ0_AGRTU|nr:hypothetical protein AGR4C_pa60073 [Agrobacterium tumefaciens str. Kerr 14]